MAWFFPSMSVQRKARQARGEGTMQPRSGATACQLAGLSLPPQHLRQLRCTCVAGQRNQRQDHLNLFLLQGRNDREHSIFTANLRIGFTPQLMSRDPTYFPQFLVKQSHAPSLQREGQ